MPRQPGKAASASPIAAAPASVVAVPMTLEPCCASVGRDRAADAARGAGDERDLRCRGIGGVAHPSSALRVGQRGRIEHRCR